MTHQLTGRLSIETINAENFSIIWRASNNSEWRISCTYYDKNLIIVTELKNMPLSILMHILNSIKEYSNEIASILDKEIKETGV